MKKLLTHVVFLSIVTCTLGQTTDAEHIRYIRQEFGKINQQCEQITPKILKLEEEVPVEIKQWEAEQSVIKIRLTRFTRAGDVVSDYYFGDPGLIFAFTQEFFKDEFGAPYTRENRYYFRDEDTMIRWLDNDRKEVDPKSDRFLAQGNKVWADMHWAGEVMWMKAAESSQGEASKRQLFIGPDHFDGIIAGGELENFKTRLRKGRLESGEGSFEVYDILEGDEKLGYIFQHRQDPERIGVIVVTTSQAATSKGIGVGSTFGELTEAYPGIQVNGSEVESRTFANVGSIGFLLDAYFSTYEVDEREIAPDTKIIEITISSN